MFAASKTDGVVAGGATDPYFPYVPLLLETTSTNGQQNNTFLDSGTANGGVGFTITRNGTPTQGSVTPYWPNGYWSNYFNGAGDYLTAPNNAAFAFGTGNFTVETYFYLTSSNTSQCIVDTRLGSASTTGFFLGIVTSGYVELYANSQLIYFNAGVALNRWYHLALVRNSTTLSVYLNGVSITSVSNSTNWTDNACKIATSFTGNERLAGYLSNFRIVKGTAVYTSNFTPPTAPVTAITNTSLLTCQSNRFKDNSTNNFTITANGTPKVQAFQPFSPTASYTTAAYGGSGYFNNASADYLSTSSATAFQFGTGTFTIEGWFYFPTVPTNSGLWQVAASNFPATAGLALSYATGAFQVGYGTSSQVTGIASGTIKAGAWVHLALVRNSSNNLTLYVDGVGYTAVASDTTNYTATTNFVIAGYYSNGYQMIGYISNFRVVKGVAVYTGAFTPPTLAPLTTAGSTSAASYSSTTNVNTSFASSATSLLLNFTNAGIYDAAVQNNALTVGDAQVSTTITAKWPPTSMKFDGTGDYLTFPNSSAFSFGTGNFTIEAWIYQTSSGTYGIFSLGNTTSSQPYFYINGTVPTILYNNTNIATGPAITLNVWTYVAVTRGASGVTVYTNGVAGTTVANSASLNSIGVWVGSNNNGTQNFPGYIQDLRVTNGIARTITTPTAAFPTR
jgi:hypothetical protein